MNSEIKIVSYNIQKGLKAEALVKNIRSCAEEGVIVFCLQEFWKWTQPIDLEIKLLEALGPDWWIEYETSDKPRYDYGLCILWKNSALQALSFKRLAFPLISKAKTWEKLWLYFHGTGKEAFIPQRGALIGTFNWNSLRLRITNLHLDWQSGMRHRMKQITYLRDYLTTDSGSDFEVICGDFNSIGILKKAKQPRIFGRILGNEFENASNTLTITCPPFSLDHMFVKNLKVKYFQVRKLPGSDHFPIFACLSRK